MARAVHGSHEGTANPLPADAGLGGPANDETGWPPGAVVRLAVLRPSAAAGTSTAPRANGNRIASSFQIQRICGSSGTSSGSSPRRRRPGHITIASAVSARIPAPTVSMNSAVTGVAADLGSIGVERDRGDRATIAITAVSPVKARAAADAPASLIAGPEHTAGAAAPAMIAGRR